MANQKEYKIIIGGIKESIEGISTLQESLDRLGKKVEESGGQMKTASQGMDELAKTNQKIAQYNKEYQEALQSNKMVLQDNAKEIKNKLELEKAELVVSEDLRETYAQKQQLLTAMGKVIKNTAGDTTELQQKYAALNQELKDFDATLGNHQRNVGDYGQATKNLKQELREYQQEMANMLNNGVSKADPAFVELAKKAGALKDAMSDAGEEMNRFASDTKKFDDVINIAQSATAAFGLYKGAMSALGMETEETEKAIQKLAGAMSVLQSLKQLSDTLQNGSMTAKLFNNSLGLLTKGMQGASLGAKALRIALASIGIGIIIGLVALLIENWEDLVGWFNKTFPAVNKLGGVMNTLKATLVGLGKAIINWVTNPLKTLAKVIKAIFTGDFEGAIKAASDGIKNQFKGTADAFKSGFQEQVERGLEDITKKTAAESAKQTKYELDMLKARKGNQAKYSKEGIELQKKEFEQRKKAAKGNAEEMKQIALDEANFNRECEEYKTQQAEKGAKARAAAAKQAAQAQKDAAREAAEAARIAEEKKKEYADSYERLVQATAASSKIALETQLKLQQAQAKELYDKGKWEEYKAALEEIKKTQLALYTADGGSKLIAFWKTFTEQFKESNLEFEKFKDGAYEAIEIAKKAGQEGRNLTEEEIQNIAKLYFNINNLNETQSNNFKALLQSILNEWQLTAVKEVELEKDKNKTIEEQDKKRYETAKNNAKKSFDNIKSLIKTTFGNGVENSPNLPSVYDRVFSKKKAKEAEDTYKKYWQSILDQTKSELLKAEEQWDIYLFNVEKLYTKDSKEYRDAVEEKKKALKELIELQNQAASGASGGTVSSDGKKKINNPSPINRNESKTKFDDKNGGFGLDSTNWDALWDKDSPAWQNMAELSDMMFENVFDPIGEAFSALLEYQIEEAQEALDKATEMHDKSVEKVEASNQRLAEIKNEMANASGAQLETLKQQQADEMLLLAQREAEEKRAAREKEKREKELAKKQKEQRKMELKMQLIEGIINTAVGVTKALTWGFPLGVVFAAIIGAMGAIQTALIAKQISKLADGGLLQGKSHEQGGIAVGNTGIEVEGGEYVVNKRSTKKYLPLLQAINEEGARKKTVANQLGKMANGGQLNYQKVSSNMDTVNTNKVIENSIQKIDMHPQVSVVDINRGQKNLTSVRQMAGASR